MLQYKKVHFFIFINTTVLLLYWVTQNYQYKSTARNQPSSRLWNQLPASLHQPRTNLYNSDLPSLTSNTFPIGSIDPLFSSSITLHFFIPGLKPSFLQILSTIAFFL